MKNSLKTKNSTLALSYDESLNEYVKKISKYPILTPQKEKELARLSSQGDENARKELIQSNLRLVFNVAKKSIHSTSLSLSDLIQEGNMGLMAAADKFNWKMGYKFST